MKVRCCSRHKHCHWKGEVERAFVPNKDLIQKLSIQTKEKKRFSGFYKAEYLCPKCARVLIKVYQNDEVVVRANVDIINKLSQKNGTMATAFEAAFKAKK